MDAVITEFSSNQNLDKREPTLIEATANAKVASLLTQ